LLLALSQTAAIALIVAGALAAIALLAVATRSLERGGSAFAGPLRAARNLLLPLLAAALALRLAFGHTHESTAFRIVATLAWTAGIWVCLSLVRAAALSVPAEQRRMPALFIDLLRFVLVAIGLCLVVWQVWGVELGGLLATLGVGSLVIGLALQDTLGGLFAGIALTSEHAFHVGDWIRIGDTVGQVVTINWRSVRLRTRERNLVIVPNSVIAKERIENYSQPTPVAGVRAFVGFSYDDAPNKVKRVLLRVALNTRGVLADPAPVVRTLAYADSSVSYEIRYFIDDYARLRTIEDELLTQIWYAAGREGLTIPFPIRTVYKTEMPPARLRDARSDARIAIGQIPVFVPLQPEELENLASDAAIQRFARGERVVHQGDPGDTLYVIRAGSATVSLRDGNGAERQVAQLGRGEFFGEMALLTGEPRTANVTAAEDLEALVIHKEALQALLAKRPALAEEMAEIVEARRQGLRAVQELQALPPERRAELRSAASVVLGKIRRFLGL
jgi:small-conductance mechanosensitive channel/CRP-like cAMP-binding protein